MTYLRYIFYTIYLVLVDLCTTTPSDVTTFPPMYALHADMATYLSIVVIIGIVDPKINT